MIVPAAVALKPLSIIRPEGDTVAKYEF